MRRFVILLYVVGAVCQAAGSSGAAMLAPFFMKEHGFSLALVGVPLVINGFGRISSDLLSGILATYMSSGVLLVIALISALCAALAGMIFRDIIIVFLIIWAVLGLSEAMFALSLRKIVFDLSSPAQQGRAQGQAAAALGIGFTLGPILAGWTGTRWGSQALFLVYGLPQAAALVLFLLAGSHKVGKPAVQGSGAVWREGKRLLRRPSFTAACLAIFQAFLFLSGVTRIGFPFLAVARHGLTLDIIGTIAGISRLADTAGRFVGGWLSDRIGTRYVVLSGVLITVPMFALQLHGTGFITLLLPLAFMTFGFGLTNVGGVTCALKTSSDAVKGIGLGIARASNSLGTMLGPLVVGALIHQFDYEGGFWGMALISLLLFVATWYAFSHDRSERALES